MSSASSLGLRVDDAVVLHDSNRITVRLMPCDVVARVAPPAHRNGAAFEVEVARRLADADAPVAVLDPRVEPSVYDRDGFVITLWTYYEPLPSGDVAPAAYAQALWQLHAAMRAVDLGAPHFTDRVAEAHQLVAHPDLSPDLGDEDRHLLRGTLATLGEDVRRRSAAEQLLHGEPHAGNVLDTRDGLLFVDLETCCVGPVEFDLAHAPDDVSDHYPHVDHGLLHDCRVLMLAMVTAWRWDRHDLLPNGRQLAEQWISQLRAAVAQ